MPARALLCQRAEPSSLWVFVYGGLCGNMRTCVAQRERNCEIMNLHHHRCTQSYLCDLECVCVACLCIPGRTLSGWKLLGPQAVSSGGSQLSDLRSEILFFALWHSKLALSHRHWSEIRLGSTQIIAGTFGSRENSAQRKSGQTRDFLLTHWNTNLMKLFL